jgi:hypothetical protein
MSLCPFREKFFAQIRAFQIVTILSSPPLAAREIRLKGAGSRLFEYTDWAIEWSFLSPENLKAKEIALVQAIGLQRRNVAWRTRD